MTIGALIAFQLVFDLLVILLLVAVARGRRAPVAPPAWHDEFLQLAREVMAVADSLLDAAPARRHPPVSPLSPRSPFSPRSPLSSLSPRDERASAKSPTMTAAPSPSPAVPTPAVDTPATRPVSARDEAFALLRDGMEPDAVARRTGLLPGELRLITSLVAAQQRMGADASIQAPRTRQGLPTAEARRRAGAAELADFPELNSSAARGTGLA